MDLDITENNLTELIASISQKHDLLSEKTSEEEMEIKKYFIARIKAICVTIKKCILAKPDNLDVYFRIWMGILPLLSIKDFEGKITEIINLKLF